MNRFLVLVLGLAGLVLAPAGAAGACHVGRIATFAVPVATLATPFIPTVGVQAVVPAAQTVAACPGVTTVQPVATAVCAAQTTATAFAGQAISAQCAQPMAVAVPGVSGVSVAAPVVAPVVTPVVIERGIVVRQRGICVAAPLRLGVVRGRRLPRAR